MNLQPTSVAPGHKKTLSLPSQKTDGMETWKEHHISQQDCRAEFEKPLQKPAHSDLLNWCLSQRRATPPGKSLDQAPWTKRMGQKFPHGRHLWMWGAGGGGRESKHRVTAAGAYVHHRAPGTAPLKYHIKAKVGFSVQGNLTINSKSLWSKTKKSSLRASSPDIQMAPRPPLRTQELRKEVLLHFQLQP